MMMLLLPIIYAAFISLGLPDALLGSAWPGMHTQFQVPVSYAGLVSMIISVGTIISSLFSDRLTRTLGTGRVTALSVALTAAALFGFSAAPSFWVLCILALPYGLGAGAIDAALNNYVALHYKSSHMSWLHCFWGVGATLGPYIMGLCLTGGLGWNSGYRTIALIQMALTVILVLSLPLWEKKKGEAGGQEEQRSLRIRELVCLPGAKAVLLAFFCYCALEQTAGLWAASYMVMGRGIPQQTAAKWASLFYLGITLGRFLGGFLAMKLGDKDMVRLGQGLAVLGVLLLFLPMGETVLCLGLLTIGLGCAPIYPSLLHETPVNFGPGLSQSIMGMQMACAYMGNTLIPPMFGLIAQYIDIRWYPCYLILFVLIMFGAAETVNRLPKYGINS